MGEIQQPDRGITLGTMAEAAENIREKHLQMVMDLKQAGKEVPAVPISASVVGLDQARQAAEASQRSIRWSSRRSFVIPALPWQYPKGSQS